MSENNKKENTKDKILDAARKTFRDKGFDGTSVEQIAKVAGVGKSLLYYYYKSKDEILFELMEKTIENLLIDYGLRRKNKKPENTEEMLMQAIESIKGEVDVLNIALVEALKDSSRTEVILELPAKIFDEFQEEFHFTKKEKVMFCLFAVRIITFYSLKEKISKAFDIDNDELDEMFRENTEPMYREILI